MSWCAMLRDAGWSVRVDLSGRSIGVEGESGCVVKVHAGGDSCADQMWSMRFVGCVW